MRETNSSTKQTKIVRPLPSFYRFYGSINTIPADMTSAVFRVLLIFFATTLCFSVAHNHAKDSQTNTHDLIGTPKKSRISPTTNIQSIGSITEEELENFVQNLKNLIFQYIDSELNETIRILTTKVETVQRVLTSLESQCAKVDTLNGSLETVVNKVGGLTSALRYSDTSKTIADGIIAATQAGVFKIDLSSLQQTNISTDFAISVAYDWNSRKVYWLQYKVGIKRSNLDGTDVEFVVKGNVDEQLAVDWITGNIYYLTTKSNNLIVCNSSGNCSELAAGQHGRISDIALHPSKGVMFWAVKSNKAKFVIRANMDGTNATVLTSKSHHWVIGVDEDSDRLYWKDWFYPLKVLSYDLNGEDRKVLVEGDPSKIVAHGATVYLGNALDDNTIRYVTKNGSNDLSLVARFSHDVYSIALYGSKPGYQFNPCQSSGCSHLCVLKLKSFACLCPEGKKLAEDGKNCV